mgnify:CR=1 FL=1
MSKNRTMGMLMASLICGSMLAAPVAGFAADNGLAEFNLDQMVVTATRTLKDIQEVPSSISVVTAKDIEEQNVTNVRDAIAQLPGVYMDRKAESGIMIRGFDAKDILILVDGQQYNSTYNSDLDFGDIPISNVERIEVLRGAASSIYGGHAVGGVVNITTKDAVEKGTHGTVTLSRGSHKTWKKSVNLDTKATDKVSFGAGYEDRKSDGFRGFYRSAKADKKATTAGKFDATANLPQQQDGYYVYGGRGTKAWGHESYNGYVKYNFDESKSIKYRYTKTKSYYRYQDPFTYVKDSDGNPVYDGLVKTQNGDIIKLSTDRFYGYRGESDKDRHVVSYQDEDNDFNVIFGYSHDRYNGFTSADLPKGYKDIDWEGAGDYSNHPEKIYNLDITKAWDNVGDHTILVGASLKRDEMDQERYTLKHWKDNNSKDKFYAHDQGRVKNAALFIQDEYKLAEPVTMYAGLRYDHFKKGSGHFWQDNGSNNYDYSSKSQSYNELSPKLAFDFKADDKTNFYVSYGHSFNPPPLYKVYRYVDYGGTGVNVWANPDLDPETSNSYEVGMKKKIGRKTNLSLTGYYVKTSDKIEYVTFKDPATGKNDHKQYVNYGDEKRRGVEFELKQKFDDKFSAYINYAWQQGKVSAPKLKDSNKNGYNDLLDYSVPKHLFHAGINYTQDRLNALLDCQYVSARMNPHDPSGEYGAEDAYFLMNTAINYQIDKDFTLQFAVDNLLDKKYFCSEACDGRTYTVGLRYNF